MGERRTLGSDGFLRVSKIWQGKNWIGFYPAEGKKKEPVKGRGSSMSGLQTQVLAHGPEIQGMRNPWGAVQWDIGKMDPGEELCFPESIALPGALQ